jgi:hypothetical protein
MTLLLQSRGEGKIPKGEVMKRMLGSWVVIALAIVACFGLFAAACGDDDSGGKSVSAPGGGTSGGSTNNSGGNSVSAPGGGGSGSDEAYVSTICKAAAKFGDDMSAATKDPSKLSDPTAVANAFTKPFEDYVNALKGAKPPSDVKDYNDKIIKALDDALASLKQTGDLSSLSSFGDNIPEPPKAAADRLENVAKGNADCQKAGFDFNNSDSGN